MTYFSTKPMPIQRLSPFDAKFRPSTKHGGSYRGVARGISASLSARQRKPVVFLLAGSLWGSPGGPAVAAGAATFADQDVSPASVAATIPDTPAVPSDVAVPEPWNLHGQFTFVKQYHPSFASLYQGTNSLFPGSNGEETTDVTLFAGVRLWNGGSFYINPEIDQGFGLSNTLGAAGFPSGEAYKVGKSKPYFRLQRAFFRQRFDLGGDSHPILPGANELGGPQTADKVAVTVGKFSVVDIFDTNAYAHDPRGNFLNWSVIDAAAFDYAADAWGYTVGAAVEWTQAWWTAKGGFFDLSDVPNSKTLEPGFKEFELPHAGGENIVETFYSMRVYQYVVHPAYNRDRGPVSIFALRVHAEF